MIDMELTVGGGKTFDQCMIVQGLAPGDKSKASDVEKNARHAVERYDKWFAENPDEPIAALIFDVLYWAGEPINRESYRNRKDIIDNIITDLILGPNTGRRALVEMPWWSDDFEEAKAEMIAEEWEGLVVWDLDMIGGFTTNGKPKRLKGCWKWKNAQDDDFVIVGTEPEKADETKVGALYIMQYDQEGNEISCGRVGSGLKKEDKLVANEWVGQVVEIEFEHRMKANADGQRCLQFPRIKRLRPDKPASECILED